jgi:nickel-dependent lactate racemase
MNMERIYRHVGITALEHEMRYRKIRFFNHDHLHAAELTELGVISAAEIETLSNGFFHEDVRVAVNKRILDYDFILMVTPVVPHETVGFSGGNKYFFPGIGGLDIIETFHWLGALITNPEVNGVKDTPTRRVIEKAASFVPIPRLCMAFTVNDHDDLNCLFIGDPHEAWSQAADYSARQHVRYMERPYKQILGIAPEIYEDIWVAGKVMYKLEPIVADGGELIIYAPHLRKISFTHDEAIRRVGYHVRDYFVKQWDRFAGESKLILAHSTNVRGGGSFENGVESPRIAVTLATGIPEAVCREINLGYRDFRKIDPDAWRSRQNEDLLVVENAGQLLYRLKS